MTDKSFHLLDFWNEIKHNVSKHTGIACPIEIKEFVEEALISKLKEVTQEPPEEEFEDTEPFCPFCHGTCEVLHPSMTHHVPCKECNGLGIIIFSAPQRKQKTYKIKVT